MDAGTPVGFRLPTSGQRNTRLYRLPSLEEVAWRFEASPRPVETVLGFAGDEDLVYAVTTNRHLVALDLASGRVRTFDSTVTHATLAPTGTVYLVREDSSVAEVARRTVRRWTTRFSAPPSRLHGMVRGRVLGLVEDPEDRRLEILADGQEPTAIAIPAGPVAVAPWGDAAAIAADSGLVILDLRAMDDPRSLPLPTTPSQVGFTASGHRILAVDSTGLLTVIERFELDVIDTLRLPSPIRALRSGLHAEGSGGALPRAQSGPAGGKAPDRDGPGRSAPGGGAPQPDPQLQPGRILPGDGRVFPERAGISRLRHHRQQFDLD